MSVGLSRIGLSSVDNLCRVCSRVLLLVGCGLDGKGIFR